MSTDTATTTEAVAFFTGLAREILQHYARGPVAVAVTGPDADAARRVADAFGAAVVASGRTVTRATGRGDEAAGALSAQLTAQQATATMLASFRARGGDVLVVDGPQLLRPALRGSWNVSIWLEGGAVPEGAVLDSEREYVRDGDPRAAASAVLNVADPDLPVRVFSDSC